MVAKKKTIICFVATLSLLSILVASHVESRKSLSAYLLENVEALANGEGGQVCYDTITGAEGQFVIYCSDCEMHPGKPSFWSRKGSC